MKKSPTLCKCAACKCGIYTYEDSEVCILCKEGQHLAGAKRKIYESNKEKTAKITF